MAQQTLVVMTDDLDGSEATQTLTFAFRGTEYEIDLNDKHAQALTESFEESFEEWIEAARTVTASPAALRGRARSSAAPAGGGKGVSRTDLDEVRSWARENGHQVADRGRVARKVVDAYDAAH